MSSSYYIVMLLDTLFSGLFVYNFSVSYSFWRCSKSTNFGVVALGGGILIF
jgi:hypothetical protein